MFIERKAHAACAALLGLLCVGGLKSETNAPRASHGDRSGRRGAARHTRAPGVRAARTEERAGEPRRFTPCYYTEAAAKELAREKRVTHSIEGPVLAYRVEPDPRRVVVVVRRGGSSENKSLLLDCAPAGAIHTARHTRPTPRRRRKD